MPMVSEPPSNFLQIFQSHTYITVGLFAFASAAASYIRTSVSDMSRAIQFRLPDLVALCPYERSFNPHFAQVAPVSDAWIDSYGVFSGEKHAFFQKSTMGLLGALFFPRADAEAFRVCCDFINVMLVLDDFCDDLDGDAARKTMQKHLTAIRGEHGDESAVSRMSREYVVPVSLLIVLVATRELKFGSQLLSLVSGPVSLPVLDRTCSAASQRNARNTSSPSLAKPNFGRKAKYSASTSIYSLEGPTA